MQPLAWRVRAHCRLNSIPQGFARSKRRVPSACLRTISEPWKSSVNCFPSGVGADAVQYEKNSARSRLTKACDSMIFTAGLSAIRASRWPRIRLAAGGQLARPFHDNSVGLVKGNQGINVASIGRRRENVMGAIGIGDRQLRCLPPSWLIR